VRWSRRGRDLAIGSSTGAKSGFRESLTSRQNCSFPSPFTLHAGLLPESSAQCFSLISSALIGTWTADIASVVQSVLTSAGVLVAGAWAYFTYFKGRTFRERLELAVSSISPQTPERSLLHVTT
jgi:hypothetical protein